MSNVITFKNKIISMETCPTQQFIVESTYVTENAIDTWSNRHIYRNLSLFDFSQFNVS